MTFGGKNLFLATALLALTLSQALAQPGAGAAPDRITVSFHGDAATSAGFAWRTSTAAAGSDLQVAPLAAGADGLGGGRLFSGKTSPATYSASDKAELVHKAQAAGLLPGTSYYYRVGDAALGAWSGTGTFVTAPASGPFTFIDLADTQAKKEAECALSAETIAKAFSAVPQAAFLAVNGDLVDTGSNERQWRQLLNFARDSLMNTTLLPAAGNHERERNAFIEHFNLAAPPGSATSSGAYYSVDYSGAHFIVLNTNEGSLLRAGLSGRQVRWLKADAAAARARGAKWIIVLMHKGPYTTSSHATDSEIAGVSGIRTRTAPLLAGLGVDLVLQGHDHVYARSRPIDGEGRAASAERTVTETLNGREIKYLVNPGGPVYLIPATAGAKVYYRNKRVPAGYFDLFEVAGESGAAAHGPDPKNPKNPPRGMVQNFTAVTIDGGRLTAVSYEIDQKANGARPFIIDQFGLIKE